MNNTQQLNGGGDKPAAPGAPSEEFQLFYFSKLLGRRIRRDKTNQKNGRLTDLVFRLAEPYPEAVGIYIEHGWGKPTEFIPWEKVLRIEDDAIFVAPPDGGGPYPPFVDQPG